MKKSKLKITQGEWNVQGEFDNIRVGVQNSKDPKSCDNYRQVCLVQQSDYEIPNYTEAEANAKLIAAAPDLLNACLKVIESEYGTGPSVGYFDDLKMKCEAAINKAIK